MPAVGRYARAGTNRQRHPRTGILGGQGRKSASEVAEAPLPDTPMLKQAAEHPGLKCGRAGGLFPLGLGFGLLSLGLRLRFLARLTSARLAHFSSFHIRPFDWQAARKSRSLRNFCIYRPQR